MTIEVVVRYPYAGKPVLKSPSFKANDDLITSLAKHHKLKHDGGGCGFGYRDLNFYASTVDQALTAVQAFKEKTFETIITIT